MASNKILFKHSSSKSREYETIDLYIAMESEAYQQRDPNYTRLLTLHWQRTIAEQEHGWYGFSLTVECRKATDLDHVHSIARRLKGRDALPLGEYTNPADVLERLHTLRATECVYDSRENEWVPLSKVMPADHKAWRDDYRAYGHTSCFAGCIAPNETEAKRGILAEFARYVSEHPHNSASERLAQWLQAGQPVVALGTYHGPPDVTPFADRINGHKEG